MPAAIGAPSAGTRVESSGERRALVAAALVATAATLVVAALGLHDWRTGDWGAEAKAAVDALRHGHLQSFFALSPAYGGSLILRAPFILIPGLWDGGELAAYRAAAAPCLIAIGMLGIWLFRELRTRGRRPLTCWAALLLCVANPVSVSAVQLGHAEELLASALSIGAVIVATRGRWGWAAVLLGLAVATKDWALLAAGPVLLALPARRARTLVLAGAVAAAVLAPLELGSGGSFGTATAGAVRAPAIFSPFQLWWFLGHVEAGINGHRAPIGWVSTIAHPLIVALAVPLTLLCALLRGRGARRPPQEALLLLVLLLLLRCALDPWDNLYYPLPLLLALVVWETLSFERLPVVSIAGVVAVRLLTVYLPVAPFSFGLDELAAGFLLAAVSGAAAIVALLYLPVGRGAAHLSRARLSVPIT